MDLFYWNFFTPLIQNTNKHTKKTPLIQYQSPIWTTLAWVCRIKGRQGPHVEEMPNSGLMTPQGIILGVCEGVYLKSLSNWSESKMSLKILSRPSWIVTEVLSEEIRLACGRPSIIMSHITTEHCSESQRACLRKQWGTRRIAHWGRCIWISSLKLTARTPLCPSSEARNWSLAGATHLSSWIL